MAGSMAVLAYTFAAASGICFVTGIAILTGGKKR